MVKEFFKPEMEFGKERNVHRTKITYLKQIMLIVISMLTVLLSSVICLAYSGIPEQVRIGLFFNDTKTNQNTAVSSFIVESETGLKIGSYGENGFTALIEEKSNNPVKVAGDKTNAYHANLGSYGSYKELAPKLEELRKSGIKAYPVYSDSWQIWSGFFPDENSVHAEFDGVLEYTVVVPSNTRLVVYSSDGEVKLVFDSTNKAFRIYPCEGGSPSLFKINGDSKKVYRGSLEVLRQTGSDMTVINVLPMEEYLYGVVPGEIEAVSHVEALKAQAVAARTYTMNNLSKYSHLKFNLCTTTNSQVYKGYSVEHPRTNKAIDDTKGEIVTYKGKPAAVFYFSSSGGKTEDVRNVWGSEGYPYLVSVDDPYESGKSWHYNWQVSYTAKKIGEIMTQRGFNLGNIQAVYITKRSEAGRAIEVVVQGTKDKRVYTNGNTRSFLSLDSQWYEITTDSDAVVMLKDGNSLSTQLNGKKVMTSSGVKTINTSGNISIISGDNTKKTIPAVPTTYTFTGKGWGHAIGMSQEGAKGMANEGFNYKEILTHYFTGCEVG